MKFKMNDREWYIEEWKISEEELCDISANSHNIIHKIVKEYFNEQGK